MSVNKKLGGSAECEMCKVKSRVYYLVRHWTWHRVVRSHSEFYECLVYFLPPKLSIFMFEKRSLNSEEWNTVGAKKIWYIQNCLITTSKNLQCPYWAPFRVESICPVCKHVEQLQFSKNSCILLTLIPGKYFFLGDGAVYPHILSQRLRPVPNKLICTIYPTSGNMEVKHLKRFWSNI